MDLHLAGEGRHEEQAEKTEQAIHADATPK
jgi:hypothetical protein